MIEMCGLPTKPANEGQSLVGLLTDPDDEAREAVLTTYARNNHSLRSERYRLIRYEDGSEEFYDHQVDPGEFTNLATVPQYKMKLATLRQLLPNRSAPYHPATSKQAVNPWFAEHLRENGVTK